MVVLIDEKALDAIKGKGVKRLSLKDLSSLIISLDFYMYKNVEFDDYISELEDSLYVSNRYIKELERR